MEGYSYITNNENFKQNKIIIEVEGNKSIKSFDEVELNNVGKTLKNRIKRDIDNMGGAIRQEDIINILVDILKTYV